MEASEHCLAVFGGQLQGTLGGDVRTCHGHEKKVNYSKAQADFQALPYQHNVQVVPEQSTIHLTLPFHHWARCRSPALEHLKQLPDHHHPWCTHGMEVKRRNGVCRMSLQ